MIKNVNINQLLQIDLFLIVNVMNLDIHLFRHYIQYLKHMVSY